MGWWPNGADQGGLPPSCIAEPPGVHLSHVTHSNDADGKVLHGGSHVGDIARAVPSVRAVLSRPEINDCAKSTGTL